MTATHTISTSYHSSAFWGLPVEITDPPADRVIEAAEGSVWVRTHTDRPDGFGRSPFVIDTHHLIPIDSKEDTDMTEIEINTRELAAEHLQVGDRVVVTECHMPAEAEGRNGRVAQIPGDRDYILLVELDVPVPHCRNPLGVMGVRKLVTDDPRLNMPTVIDLPAVREEIEGLKRQAVLLTEQRDEQKTANAELINRVATWRTRAVDAEEALNEFKQSVVDKALELAEEHDWCDVVAEALEALGLGDLIPAKKDLVVTLRIPADEWNEGAITAADDASDSDVGNFLYGASRGDLTNYIESVEAEDAD